MTKEFVVEITATVVIDLEEAVIDVVDDEWRSHLYNLKTPEEIAEHIAYNMIVNGAKLSQLDGWADQPDENATIMLGPSWEFFAELGVTK